MQKFIIITIALAIFGCEKKEDTFQNDYFSNKHFLKGEIVIEQSKLLDPVHIASIDSFLIISNYKGEPLIEIFTKSGDLVTGIINYGKGPREMLIVGDIQTDINDKAIYICDLALKKILKCDLEKAVNNINYKPSVYYNLNSSNAKKLMFDKIWLGNDFLLCESRSPQGRILILDPEGNNPFYHLDYPDKTLISSNISDFDNAKLYASTLCLSPDRSKLAIATYSAGMLELYQINKNKIDRIWSINEFFPQGIKLVKMGERQVAVHTQESVSGYLDICCSKKYVYALYSGKKLSESDYAWGKTVKVISWNGDETFEYILNRKVKRIDVTKNDEFLYGVSENSNKEPEIIRFILKNN